MSTRNISQETLVSILRSRDASIDSNAIAAALRDPESGPALADWAATHLADDTLLSLDELELYEALEHSGRVDELAARAETSSRSPALPVSDGALRSAISALDGATTAITKQVDVLQHQQEALARLAKTCGPASSSEARQAFEARHLARWTAERSSLTDEVAQLSRALDDRAADLAQQRTQAVDSARQTVDALCRSDDTLLASLQKLGWALTTTSDDGDAQEQQRLGALRDVCVKLIKLTVEAIRTKLDRLYLEALGSAAAEAEKDTDSETDSDSDTDAGTSREDAADLQEELESLYSEILPVAQMSVDQQYLEPALKSMSGRHRKGMARSLLALDYIDECLDFLLEHIALLSARIETATAHQTAADSLVATARAELALAVPTATPRKKDPYGAAAASPARRRLSGQQRISMSPARTRSGTGGRRRSSGVGALADMPPLDQLLQDLSLLLPMPDDMWDSSNSSNAPSRQLASRVNTRFLQGTLADRAAKASGVAAGAQESFEEATATHLGDARRAVTMARESVLAETPFGAVQLADPEIDSSIAVMAQEVAKISARLDGVVQALARARQGSAKRDALVARWGE